MFSYVVDQLRTTGSKDQQHLGRIVEVETELITLGGFLRTVCRATVSGPAADDMARVCGEGVVFISVSQSMFRMWF